ncbi:alpha/beta hydrolase, partial [Rhizobium sp. KAs_5_22]
IIKELRMIALLQQVVAESPAKLDSRRVEGARWASFRVHLLSSPVMIDLGYSSKLNAEWEFLAFLRAEGRWAAGLLYD